MLAPRHATIRDGLSTPLFLEAFRASGEKRLWLTRLLYGAFFGPRWRPALLGFAYVKCVDNTIDREPDVGTAKAFLDRQRALLARAYAGAPRDATLPAPDRYGAAFFVWDRAHGANLRRSVEEVFDTFEVDLARRHRLLSGAELDRNVRIAGTAVLRYLGWFASPARPLSEALLERGSRAYIYADHLVDLEEDLRFGLCNVPAEDAAALGIDPFDLASVSGAWLDGRVPGVERCFDEALAEVRRTRGLRLRLLCRLYLGRKRAELRRFLARRSAPVLGDQPASGSR